MEKSLAINQYNIRQIRNYRFVPSGNWTDTATYVMQTFPDDMPMYVTLAPDSLENYLDKTHPVERSFSMEKYLEGRMILVDSDWLVSEVDRWRPSEISSNSVEILIPQIRGTYQNVAVTPPLDSHITQVTIDENDESFDAIDDQNLSTELIYDEYQSAENRAVKIYLDRNQLYRPFYLVLSGKEFSRYQFEVYEDEAGHRTRIDNQQIKLQQDLTSHSNRSFLVFSLQDKTIDYLEFSIPENSSISIMEGWAYSVQ